MQELSNVADVVTASDADPQCTWAAQGLQAGGRAWEHEGAVAVACPQLYGRDRVVVRGAVAAAVRLAREAIDALGPSFLLVGDPPLTAGLLARMRWLEPYTFFGWMDGTRRPRHQRVHLVRWLARREWQAATEVLDVAAPTAYARPWLPGIRRWAGIADAQGRLTCTIADAWSVPGLGFMAGLAVLPQARGAGQGQDATTFVLEALLAAHGRAALITWDCNSAAARMYAKLGMSCRPQQILRVKQAGALAS
jgi:ribosomal protein S18 acetylase RimI-like enzyme